MGGKDRGGAGRLWTVQGRASETTFGRLVSVGDRKDEILVEKVLMAVLRSQHAADMAAHYFLPLAFENPFALE